tara:strand:- start:223 stop:1050 length:828 start_codon:yes stop_codon:yes gene_type:complete
MTSDIYDTTEPCVLVFSEIIHTRHGHPAHHLRKAGFSILIDLDRLNEAQEASWFFSVNKFNLVSFHEADFGPNHKSQRKYKEPTIKLSDHIRRLASQHFKADEITKIEMLTFPRILGLSFNPITVYRCLGRNGKDCFRVYEVHNTFGDSHSYASVIKPNCSTVPLHKVDKMMHVSPFFEVEGYYQLAMRRGAENLKLIVRYFKDNQALLTATLHGKIVRVSTGRLLQTVFLSGHFPLRPLLSIHFEAVKLFFKGLRFYKRPTPPHHAVTQTAEDL